MKKKIVISCVCIFIVLVLSIGVYWCFHPTHYKFNDRFIIGNSKDNIIEKYGEFDYSKYESNNYRMLMSVENSKPLFPHPYLQRLGVSVPCHSHR